MRVRFRTKNSSRYIYENPGTPAFKKEYEAALTGKNVGLGAGQAGPGTITKLFAIYYKSPEFTGLAETTKPSHRGILERFKKKHGHKRVAHLQKVHLKEILGKMADRPNAANNLLKRLSFVLDMAVDLEWIKVNPALGIKKYKIKSGGHHSWTEEEITAYEAAHPSGTKARLAFALLLYTASRRGDAILLGRQHIKNGRLQFTQHKTDESMDLPIHQELLNEIQAIDHSNLTFIVTSYGQPFSNAGFGNWFRSQCDKAGLKGCSAHGLRKAATRRVIEAGKTIKQAGALTGHRTLSEIARYSDRADRALLADQVIDGLTKPKKRT